MWYHLMSKHESEWPYGIPRGVRGLACAIQPHHEVKPESGLSIYEIYDMKACRITTLFSGRVGGGGQKGEKEMRGLQVDVSACLGSHLGG